MIIEVKYAGFTDGTANILVPVDPTGSMEARTLDENDVVMSILSSVPNTGAVICELLRLENGTLAPSNPQHSPGDLVVVICPASDVSYLAGQVGVVASDGSLSGASSGVVMFLANQLQQGQDLTAVWDSIANAAQNIQWLNDQVNALNVFQQNSATNSITPMAPDSPVNLVENDGVVCVSADTSEGDVVVNLPSAYPNRPPILITNRNGSGVVQIVAQEPIYPSGGTTLVLGESDRVTLQSFGGGWERL